MRANSGEKAFRVPKLPPMSPNTARQRSTGTPKVAARRARVCTAPRPEPVRRGIAAGRGVVLPDDRPRLERRPGHAVDPASEAHHASRPREGRIRRRAVPDLAGEGEVVGRPGQRRGAPPAIAARASATRRPGLVVHLDLLARVGGRPPRSPATTSATASPQ